MRCDYPSGYDEDYLEPACDLFLQLFLQNAQIANNEEPIQDVENAVNVDFGGYESDDNFSFPSIHTISDGSVSSGSSMYGDEEQAIVIDAIAIASHFVENISENEESCSLDNGIVEVPDENTDIPSEIDLPISNIYNEDPDDIQEPNDPSIDDDTITEVTIYPEISGQTDVTSHVSVFVVVPPADFTCITDSSSSEISSDTLLVDTLPINSTSPSFVVSDIRNNLPDCEYAPTDNKICDNSEGTASESSATCSSLSVTENDKKDKLSDLDSVLDVKCSDSSENTIGYDENSHAESMAIDTPLSEETSVYKDENINCGAVSDKSVPNLKRKVTDSVDDNVLSKMPKYSLPHESSEPINETLDTYCKDFSTDTERATISEEGSINVLPSTANAENVIFPSQMAVDENLVTE